MTSANPSLSAIFTGLKPVRQHPNVRCCHPKPFDMIRRSPIGEIVIGAGKARPCSSPSRDYFLFPSGSVRRQVGQGHSSAERKARRQVRNFIGRVNSMKATWAEGQRPSLFAMAANLVSGDLSLRPCQR